MRIWLFTVLSQIQIFLSLIAAGFPALKKTVFDMLTNYGVNEDSQTGSRSGPSYIMNRLSRKNKSNHSAGPESGHSIPFSGTGRGHAVVVRGKPKTPTDDDSQKGIMRQDDYAVVVSYESSDPQDFDH